MQQKEKIPFIRSDLFIIPPDPSQKPYLVGSKCGICGRVFFPKKGVCFACLKEGTLADIALSRRGKIYQAFMANVAPVGYQAPYVVGWVELSEGVRVFSVIKDDIETPPGTDVELVIEELCQDDEGDPVTGFKFAPVR